MDILIAILDFVLLVAGKTLGGVLETLGGMLVCAIFLFLSIKVCKVVDKVLTILGFFEKGTITGCHYSPYQRMRSRTSYFK